MGLPRDRGAPWAPPERAERFSEPHHYLLETAVAMRPSRQRRTAPHYGPPRIRFFVIFTDVAAPAGFRQGCQPAAAETWKRRRRGRRGRGRAVPRRCC
jgi:hypothetical protein